MTATGLLVLEAVKCKLLLKPLVWFWFLVQKKLAGKQSRHTGNNQQSLYHVTNQLPGGLLTVLPVIISRNNN